LAGTSVTVTIGTTVTPAIVIFAFGTQVNAILPSTTPVGTGSVTVTYNNQTSTPAPIQVAASAFGIYTYNSSGSGQAIATDTGYQMNTIIHTFHPGDYVILWGTGLGPIATSDAEPPPAGNLSAPVTMHVGKPKSGSCDRAKHGSAFNPTGCENSGCHQNGELRRSWKLVTARAVPSRLGAELPDLGSELGRTQPPSAVRTCWPPSITFRRPSKSSPSSSGESLLCAPGRDGQGSVTVGVHRRRKGIGRFVPYRRR